MPYTGKAALDRAAAESAHPTSKGPRFWRGLCLQFVRIMFGVGWVASDAAGAWDAADHKHKGDQKPPLGVPVYWLGGSSGHGHIAISCGDGTVWSNDIKRSGQIDRVPLSRIVAQWGLKYVGWSEDLGGVRVYTPPTPHPQPHPQPVDQWVVLDGDKVVVYGKAGQALNQGAGAGSFKPQKGHDYKIGWRKV